MVMIVAIVTMTPSSSHRVNAEQEEVVVPADGAGGDNSGDGSTGLNLTKEEMAKKYLDAFFSYAGTFLCLG